MGEKRNTYRLLAGKRLLGRPRRRWVVILGWIFLELEWAYVNSLGLAQDRNRLEVLVNSVLNLRVP
jgi:hypothetical protein